MQDSLSVTLTKNSQTNGAPRHYCVTLANGNVSVARCAPSSQGCSVSAGEECACWGGWGMHSGPKSLILAPQDIPDFLGYQLGFGCQCVKAYNNENPVTNQKIL